MRLLSVAGKFRLTTFANRADTLADVSTEKVQHLHRERSIEGGAEHANPVVERALGEPRRFLRAVGELARDLECLIHQLVRRCAYRDQTDALRLFAIDEIRREQVI